MASAVLLAQLVARRGRGLLDVVSIGRGLELESLALDEEDSKSLEDEEADQCLGKHFLSCWVQISVYWCTFGVLVVGLQGGGWRFYSLVSIEKCREMMK